MTRAHLQLGGVERRPRAVSSGVDVASAKRRAMENDPGTTGADRNCPRQTGADGGIRCGAKGTISNNFFFFQKNRDASDRNLDLENGWRQRREVVGTVKRLMPGLLEGISDFM